MTRFAQALALLAGVVLLPAPGIAMEPYLPNSANGFSEADVNSDGKITAAELTPKVERRFVRLDTDKNGGLTAAEIEAAFKRALERRRDRLLARLDTDKDGQISRAELDAAVERLIVTADTDKDGAVTVEEVRRFRLVKAAKPATGETGN